MRGRAASWRASGPTCRCAFDPDARPLSRRVTRALLRALHAARVSIARARVRTDGRNDRQGLRDRRSRSTICERWPTELKRPAASACACLPDSPSAMRAGIVGLSFSTAPRQARYVPLPRPARGRISSARADGDEASPDIDRDAALALLKPLLEDASIAKIGHDLKFDAIVLAQHGITLRGLGTDVMIASYLLDANRSAHPLEDLAIEHSGYKALSEEDVCGRGAKSVSFADIPVERARDYAGERADLALQLAPTLATLLKTNELQGLRRSRAAAHPGARRHRARGHPGRHRSAGRTGRHAWIRSSRAWRAQSTSSPARNSTSIRRKSCRRFSSTGSACARRRSAARRRPRRSRQPSRCSRSWR